MASLADSTTHARASIRGVAVGSTLFALFALNFGAYRVFGDGLVYYSFVRRLFGERADGSGYNFGVGLLNAPFFGVAKLVHTVVHHGRIEPASITIASIAYVVVALAGSAWIIARLQLPLPGVSATAAVFGTPIWYYGSFSPSYSHAVDAAVFTLAALCIWKLLQSPDRAWRVATGAALGLAMCVRPYNAAAVVAFLVALAVARRLRDALSVAVVTVVSAGLLLVLPLTLGTNLTEYPNGARIHANTAFVPLNPLRMLFSLHRGLFTWTPAALLAAIGLVWLLRRGGRERLYVSLLTAMFVGLLCAYGSFRVWDGGWSFSARYLAAPVPLYAIGLSSLFRWAGSARRGAVLALVTASVVFSVFLGMNHAFGASQRDGANDIIGFYASGKRTAGDFAHLTWSYSRLRHVVNRLTG